MPNWLRNLIRYWLRGRIPTPPPPIPPPVSGNGVVDEINLRRQDNGLRALAVSECLAIGANRHASWMNANSTLNHDGFRERLRICSFSVGSENVAHGQTSAKMVVDDWMASAGHRKNILGPWDVIGADHSGTYWCAIFAEA